MSVTWPDPALHVPFPTPPHFVRLTGRDGAPGLPGASGFSVWGTRLGADGKPDLENIIKVAPDGTELPPKQGDWVITNDGGNLLVWRIGAGGTFGTPIDLADGPKGPPGQPSGAQHTHNLEPATGIPTYQAVRDRFAGVQFTVGETQVYEP